MKTPSLDQQISVVKDEIECRKRSYTHRIGKWKGRIPPGQQLDECNALRAIVHTLRKLKQIVK